MTRLLFNVTRLIFIVTWLLFIVARLLIKVTWLRFEASSFYNENHFKNDHITFLNI